MSELDYWTLQHLLGKISRREFLGRAAALGAGAALTTSLLAQVEARAADTPKKGGVLKAGMAGGSTSDTMNPTTTTDSVGILANFSVYSALIENGADNKPIPELAESYEAKPGAAEWVLNLRQGVTFSNGKSFGADDVIYSLNLHRGQTKSGAAGPMKAVTDVKKLGPNQVQVTLASGDADFAYVLSDYHLMMVPDGFTDWANPIGTGAFVMDKFDPGVRVSLKRNASFWKKDRGWLDGFEVTVINDSSARTNALISGQVDVINRVDPKTVALVQKAPKVAIVRAPAGWHAIMPMRIDLAPYSNPDTRLALKLGVDREQMMKTLFAGFGNLGNDHPIPKGDPFFNSELAQTKYDPDKAKFHYQKAGSPAILLQASDAAFNGAVDMATLMQASCAKAGIKIEVKKEPADGFWDNVWLKAPFMTGYWGGRPAATQMLGVAYAANAPWNETHWNDPKFEKLLADARGEINEDKRRVYIYAMQEMLHSEGGAIIPAFRDYIDAHNAKVGGHTPHSGFDMDNCRLAEKAWVMG